MIVNVTNNIYHPLAAIIVYNARMMLQRGNLFAWGVACLVAVAPALVFRGMVFWFSGTDVHLGPIEDAYFVYSNLSAVLYLQLFVPLLALMLGLSLITQEIENETVVYLLARPIPRTVLVLGKFLAYLVISVCLLSSALILTFLILATIPDAALITMEWDTLLLDIWVFTLGLGAYGAVLMFIGVCFKHKLIISLLLIFVWDSAATMIPGSAYRYTIRHYLASVFPHELRQENPILEMLTSQAVTPAMTSTLILLGIMAAGILLTTLIIKHRELPIGQAETE